MKVYTGGGDKGKTSLFSGERVAKHSLRLDCYGDIDELNSVIGALIAALPKECKTLSPPLEKMLDEVQRRLFQASAWLATTENSAAIKHLDDFPKEFSTVLEQQIDAISDILPPLNKFIFPSGDQAANWAHLARTVCRRCERKAAKLLAEEPEIGQQEAVQNILVYLNRLSDYFFVLARAINHIRGVEEKTW